MKVITAIGSVLLASLFCAALGVAARPVHQASGGGTVDYADARNTPAFTAQIGGTFK